MLLRASSYQKSLHQSLPVRPPRSAPCSSLLNQHQNHTRRRLGLPTETRNEKRTHRNSGEHPEPHGRKHVHSMNRLVPRASVTGCSLFPSPAPCAETGQRLRCYAPSNRAEHRLLQRCRRLLLSMTLAAASVDRDGSPPGDASGKGGGTWGGRHCRTQLARGQSSSGVESKMPNYEEDQKPHQVAGRVIWEGLWPFRWRCIPYGVRDTKDGSVYFLCACGNSRISVAATSER